LLDTQAIQKRYYNKGHIPKEFEIGDEVLLSIKNIRTKRIKKKLDHRWLGPFKVVRKTKGNQAYKLELPKLYLIYPTFYVSLLELYRRKDGVEPPPPSEINRELE